MDVWIIPRRAVQRGNDPAIAWRTCERSTSRCRIGSFVEHWKREIKEIRNSKLKGNTQIGKMRLFKVFMGWLVACMSVRAM